MSRHTSVAALSGPRVWWRTPLRQATNGRHVRGGNQPARDHAAISAFSGTRRTSDRGGGDPLPPAEALRKRHARTDATPIVATPATAYVVIVHPLSSGRFTGRDNPHPPAEAHIARLEAMVAVGTRAAPPELCGRQSCWTINDEAAASNRSLRGSHPSVQAERQVRCNRGQNHCDERLRTKCLQRARHDENT